MVARPRRHPQIWLPRHRDRCRPPRTQDRQRREHQLFPAGAGHRLERAAAQSARRRSAGRLHLSRYAATSICCWRWPREKTRRRGRRRIARARGRLWPGKSRRAGDADPSDGPADGTPARWSGGGIAEVAGRTQGHQYPAQRQHRAHSRHDAGRRRRTDRRPHAGGRRGDLCRRHPAQYFAGKGSRHSRQPRRRGRRSSADRRAGHFRARRMRRASRHLLRAGRAGL